MTPDQHQIERMRAWTAFMASRIGANDTSTIETDARCADKALEAFDARFPAPKEAPEPDWIPHTPGDPMPCDGKAILDTKLRNGSETKGFRAEVFDWRPMNNVGCEIIAWRPAQ